MTDELKKTTYYVELFDFYGNLLTLHQKQIMSDYYFHNLSLSEISELRNISRPAVSDALNKAVTKLKNFEKKLKLHLILNEFKKTSNAEEKAIIVELERKIKHGI